MKDETMLAIGVDPDTKHSGWAAVQSFNGGFQIVQVGLIRAKGRTAADRRAPMAESLLLTLLQDALPYPPTALALEWQHLRGSSAKEKNPGAIVELCGFAGMALQAFIERWEFEYVFTPTPSDWKKSVPKHVHQSRICSRLGITTELRAKDGEKNFAPGAADIPPSMRSHVIDALGLALWALDPYGPIYDARAEARAKR